MSEEFNQLPTQIVIPQQQETVEVVRNTKGYNYTVKMIGIDLKRLKETTDELNKIYPRTDTIEKINKTNVENDKE